jgi:RNA polymerase sigma-70 factor (ECF subfamily)
MREVLWLVDVEGFLHHEASALLDVPEGTIASRLYRARRALRDALAEWVESLPGKKRKDLS